MSNIGVPSTISAPVTYITGPSSGSSRIFSIFTTDKPSEFGLNDERVANTPTLVFPPSLGGLTVGVHLLLPSSSRFLENCQISQICENSSNPLRQSLFLNLGSNTILPLSPSTTPGCLGIPNFSGKSVLICAIFSNMQPIICSIL